MFSSTKVRGLTFLLICSPLINLCCCIYAICIYVIARTSRTILNRYGENGQYCLVPDFSGITLISLHLFWCCLLAYYILSFLCLGMFPVSLLSQRLLSWRDFVFCQRLYQQLMWWSCLFFFQFVYVVEYIDRFSHVEPSLHLWDAADLSKMDDLFDVFFNSVCQYFIEYFSINVHEWAWSVILSLSNVFVWFGYEGKCSLIKKLKMFLLFYFVEQFEEYWY